MAKLTTQPAVDLLSLMDDYDTDGECRAYLEELRWPKGVECPRCASNGISRIAARKVFECNECRYQFSVMAGTLFNDSHLPLPKWFLAIFLITESKKGMSALQLKRLLKVSYKTAWYLCHRIRAAMIDPNEQPLTGTVEVDETYIGGQRRGVGRGNYKSRKTMIVAALQRDGDIRVRTGARNDRKTLHGFIKANVSDSAENIYTDSLPSYIGCGDANTKHEAVNHNDGEYARGTIHTNTVEGAFGLFKRAIVGSYHQISVKHIDRYIDEFEFRYNNRKNAYFFRDVLVRLMESKAMPYEKLTA